MILNTVPLPAEVPPQETVYHCQDAPVPRVPPTSDKVTEVPGQTVRDGFPVTVVTSEDKLFTVTVAV